MFISKSKNFILFILFYFNYYKDMYYQPDDLVRCVIVSVDEQNDVCHASLTSSTNSNIYMVKNILINKTLNWYDIISNP